MGSLASGGSLALGSFAPSSLAPGSFALQQPLIDWAWISANLSDEIWPAVVGHIFLCSLSIGIALVISLPVGVLVARYRRAYAPVVFFTGFLFSIPSLAFFAILVAIPAIGIGFRAVIIALVAYSLLILIRNVVTGIDSVPPETIDAARGMGLTPSQILFRVELPLALPVIVAGIRIAVVTVIGIATIGAYIDGGGIGVLIFNGIGRGFFTQVIVGAVLATALAVAADLLLLAMERYLRPWARVGRT